MAAPSSTYRLQLNARFPFERARDELDYLGRLGAGAVHLSPMLTAVAGSPHGYDVVDHGRVSPDLGGLAGLEALHEGLAAAGLGAVADIVPNHMAIPPETWRNRPLWSVLRDGPGAPGADWFDIDWDGSRQLVLPVLGDRIGTVLHRGELTCGTLRIADTEQAVLRYFDHVFPLRPGTEDAPLPELLELQWYRLAYWRSGVDDVNYRRFFDVSSLIALQAEDPAVFAATHRLILDLVDRGVLTGLRIDHVDGLASPPAYLRQLHALAPRAWVVVEKILARDEELPAAWDCAGTTGYDALHRVQDLFLDPAGAEPLAELWRRLAPPARREWSDVAEAAVGEAVDSTLVPEVRRLTDVLVRVLAEDVRLRDYGRREATTALRELVLQLGRYRTYAVPGRDPDPADVRALAGAVRRSRIRLGGSLWPLLDVVADLALGRPAGSPELTGSALRQEFVTRFGQTTGPVMAKGVEDTAFYRWHRLLALNEVGGHPDRFGGTADGFHAWAAARAGDARWSAAMTTLSTHDTKRSEDVRARLVAVARRPGAWAELWREIRRTAVREGLRHPERPEDWQSPAEFGDGEAAGRLRRVARVGRVDAPAAYFVLQTVVGTWASTLCARPGPIPAARLGSYLTKAVREAGVHTDWLHPDPDYERAVLGLGDWLCRNDRARELIEGFVHATDQDWRATVLGQKLVQLTMPGVPDVYQGTELVDLSLVDPDNRRAVDFAERRRRLAALDAGRPPADVDDEKLMVVSRALRLRRAHPEWFLGPGAGYGVLAASTSAVLGFRRGGGPGGGALTVVTRRVPESGSWASSEGTADRPAAEIVLPALPAGARAWRDVLDARARHPAGAVALADLLRSRPVALLVPEPDPAGAPR